MDNFVQILDQLPSLLNQAAMLIIFIFAVVGLAMTYAGLKVYWICVFLSGMPWGVVLGAGFAAIMGASDIGIIATALGCGISTGLIAVALTRLAVFLVGMLAGALLILLLGVNEPVVVLMAAIVCGVIAIFVYDWAIIVGTAITGSSMLLFVTLNVIAIARQGRPAVLPGDFISYLFHLGERAYADGSMHGLARAAVSDLLIFGFFLITGIVVQLNLFSVLKTGSTQKTQRPAADLPAKQIPSHTESEPASHNSGNGAWRISVLTDGSLYRTCLLEEGALTIGRGDDADIRVSDDMVSRRHLEIVKIGDRGVRLQDLGSGNGTWKQGTQMVKQDYPTDRDWYQLGRVQVVFRWVGGSI